MADSLLKSRKSYFRGWTRPSYLPPLTRITISRTVEAVNYEPRQGATNVDLSGTDLMLGSRPQQTWNLALPRNSGIFRGARPSATNISPASCGQFRRKAALPMGGNAGGQQSKRQIHATTDMHACIRADCDCVAFYHAVRQITTLCPEEALDRAVMKRDGAGDIPGGILKAEVHGNTG